jgi:hypothetical protein
MKIIHTPSNIGNHPYVLSRHERTHGVESNLVVHYIPPEFLYSADKALGTLGGESDEEIRARITEGLNAPLNYDVLHYYFGRTLFSWDDYSSGSPFLHLDLKIAKILRKRIFFTLQGCDVRLAARSFERNAVTMCREGACQYFQACVGEIDAKRLKLINDVLPLADKVFYLNPELGHYLPEAEFLPYSSVEISAVEQSPPTRYGPIKIVHAPSNPEIKGTPQILAALEALKPKYDFELILIENMPHQEAMQAYQQADIVIDQVLSGWYGGFAVEVMAMGKPVLCYLRKEDFVNAPSEMIKDLPVLAVHPDTLAVDIAAIFDKRDQWREWSQRSRRFVERWHDPAKIAAAMLEAYRNPTEPFNLDRYCK